MIRSCASFLTHTFSGEVQAVPTTEDPSSNHQEGSNMSDRERLDRHKTMSPAKHGFDLLMANDLDALARKIEDSEKSGLTRNGHVQFSRYPTGDKMFVQIMEKPSETSDRDLLANHQEHGHHQYAFSLLMADDLDALARKIEDSEKSDFASNGHVQFARYPTGEALFVQIMEKIV